MDANGQLAHHVPIELPGDRLPHDMGITENFSILHDLPVFHCPEALKAGRHKIRFDASISARFGVIPRYGKPGDIQWFEFTPCFLYHVINCWEDGDEIVMTACRFMPVRNADGDIDEEATAKKIARLGMEARIWQYRMNLKTGETLETCLEPDHNLEFPGYNTAFTGRKSTWAYLVDHDPNMLRWRGLRKYNIETGVCVGAWTDGYEDCWYTEPWFAARDNAVDEDDGYVVLFCWNERTETQQLQVFDAKDLSAGPACRITLPRHVPVGFHGCWMRSDQIDSWGA